MFQPLPRIPDWLLIVLVALTVLGAACVMAVLGYGIFYLITHLKFTP